LSHLFFNAFMTTEHYENFPVASLLLPANLRPAVKVIYAFARSADDFADEGEACAEDRIKALAGYEAQLEKIRCGQSPDIGLFQELAKVIKEYEIPVNHFCDLLSAFKQDVTVKRYHDYSQLLDYCERSANPVGRIMLHLYRATDIQNMTDSDKICSALQLINFWQDVAIDWQKDRIYIPVEDMMRFGVSETTISQGNLTVQWQALSQFEIARTRNLLIEGSHLCKRLPGRIGLELRFVVQGGLRILEKIEKHEMDVFRRRPTINAFDSPLLFWRAACM
jgi:squalene synthase HpnC